MVNSKLWRESDIKSKASSLFSVKNKAIFHPQIRTFLCIMFCIFCFAEITNNLDINRHRVSTLEAIKKKMLNILNFSVIFHLQYRDFTII